jgi:crotonobetainyl-CoA:carnitine CoA-transferase CaiB-like acyl-CoA transferase
VQVLNKANIPAGPVYSVPQVFEDEQVKHLGVVENTTGADGRELPLVSQPVRLERTPARVVAPAPDIGQHSDEVLREAGYGDDEIAALRASGAV